MTKQLPESIFDLKTISITDDAIETKWSRMTPSAIKEKVKSIHDIVRTDPKLAISEIQELSKKYKDVPILNNFLCSCYLATGDYKNSETIAIENYKLFPRYIFAKTNYAQLCLTNGETDKIPEIFEGKRDLQSLYPERKEFHISEFLSFMGVWSVYFYKTGEKDLARSYYKIMRKADRSHPLTKSIKRQIYPPLLNRVLEKY